jgi:hypothetical protein
MIVSVCAFTCRSREDLEVSKDHSMCENSLFQKQQCKIHFEFSMVYVDVVKI